jgi:hypothetical protein
MLFWKAGTNVFWSSKKTSHVSCLLFLKIKETFKADARKIGVEQATLLYLDRPGQCMLRHHMESID